MQPKKIIVLGGGLAGLAAADFLSRKHKVFVLEKNDYLGGLAASFYQEDYHIPLYYHHVIARNVCTRKYLDRYELLDGCVWKRMKVVIGVDGRVTDIANPLGLLRFDYLSFFARFRFGVFGLYVLFCMNPKKISDNLDAQAWLNSIAGREVTEKVFVNLYARNKFNIPLAMISASQLAHRLSEKEVYSEFTYPPKGLHRLIENLERDIKDNGGEALRSCNVSKIDLSEKKVYVNSKIIQGDIILSTIPMPEFLAIAEGLPPDYRNKISKIKYCPVVSVAFGTEDFLDKRFYWINLFGEKIHVIVQHSVLHDNYPFKINWCIRYGGSEDDLPLSDETIKKEYLSAVKKYFPDCKITWARAFREKYAEPIYDKDYGEHMPDFRSPVEGLYFAGIQLTFPKIRNMNSALESGLTVANSIEEDLQKD